jgi:Domain of unknown function (DUF4262)
VARRKEFYSPTSIKPPTLAVTVSIATTSNNMTGNLSADIETFGWTVQIIPDSEYLPSFAYTAGLWKNYKHPEVISFGLTNNTLHIILNIAGEMVKSGQILELGKPYAEFFENGSTEFLKVDNKSIADYFGYAIEFYNTKDFPALQLVWTDRNNNFPWDNNYQEEFLYRQPLLDRNSEFKFREVKNLAVFTTRQWTDLKKPILRVVHDTDGEWQFLTGDQMPEDIKIVALEEMTKVDKTLNDIFNLDYGEQASRGFIGDRWDRTNSETSDD